jgi:hypothetical protein
VGVRAAPALVELGQLRDTQRCVCSITSPGAFTHQPEEYDYNPLLFDFVLKRRLRLPGTRQRLPPSLFMANPSLER